MTTLTPAERALVEANLGLVGFTVRRHYGYLDPDDIAEARQDGILGLVRAVQGWDPARGTLSTYAIPWIRQAIERGRGRLEGINYRRAAAANETLPGTVPLEEATDAHLTPAPVDVAELALARVRYERAVAGMAAAVRDRHDGLVAGWMIGELRGQPRSIRSVADEYGIPASSVTIRRRRLERAARVAS